MLRKEHYTPCEVWLLLFWMLQTGNFVTCQAVKIAPDLIAVNFYTSRFEAAMDIFDYWIDVDVFIFLPQLH